MKIAITYENGQVFQHFGHCPTFKFYEIENNAVKSTEEISAEGSGHGALSGFLKSHGADALICGGIGGGACVALDQAGIKLYPGVSGNADECIAAYLAGTLAYAPDALCSHHHMDGHTCASHTCGENKNGCAGNR